MASLLWLSTLALASTGLAETLYSSYSFDPLQHLAGIAPYFEPSNPPRDPSVPQGCSVAKAAYLVRHAAINANDFDYETYIQPFLDKLGNNTAIDWSKIPDLAFLATWTPPVIAEQELLTRTGKLEAAQLGVSISYRYPTLRLPERVWASTAERTVKSAQGLIRGLEMDDDTINLVQIYEGDEAGANTLTPYSSCPGYSKSAGSDQEREYIDRYTKPILARFNALAPTFNFTANDVVGMQELCGYDTVIRGSSPFCSLSLFTPDDWLAFEYSQDLIYHYNTGYGGPLSGVIGYPWLNATAQLLSSSSSPDSQSSPEQTQDQDLYISFTHRELPPTVLVALGLFNNSQLSGANQVNATMPTTHINYNRAWVSSRILPFLTNIAIEKMNCSLAYGYNNNTTTISADSNTSLSSSNTETPTQDSTYYRILVNQSPQTLPDCFDGPAESCSAAAFAQFVSQRGQMFGGYSQKCGVEYKNSTDVLSFYDAAPGNGSSVGKMRARWEF